MDEKSPEVVFARQVEAAARKGEADFFALFSEPPKDLTEKAFLKEVIFNELQNSLANSGKIISVTPMDEKSKKEVERICAEPYEVKFAFNDGTSSGELSVPIGQVNGVWRILNNSK